MKRRSLLVFSILIVLLFSAVTFDPLGNKYKIETVKGDEGGTSIGTHDFTALYEKAYIWDDHDSGLAGSAGEWYFLLWGPSDASSGDSTGEIDVDGPQMVDFPDLSRTWSVSGNAVPKFHLSAWEDDTLNIEMVCDLDVARSILDYTPNAWYHQSERVGDVTCYFAFVIENGQPTAAGVVGPSSGYRGGTYSFDTTASDPNDDSLTYEWTIDGVAQVSTTSSMSYTFPTWSTLGSYTISVRAKDAMGAYSDWVSKTFTLNSHALPTLSIDINNGDGYTTSTAVTLSLTYAATEGATVSDIRFSNDGIWDVETWEAPVASKTWTLTNGDGGKDVYVQARDSYGALSSLYADYVLLDQTPPTGSITINAGADSTSSTSVTLSLTFQDETSGVSQVRYSNDGIWDTEAWDNPPLLPLASEAWTLLLGDGAKTVWFQVKDQAGLLSPTYSDTIYLALSKVSTPMFSPTGGTYSSTQTVTISCATSSATIRYTTNGVDPTSTTGTVYSSPVSVPSTITLKAKAFASGMTDSDTASATYIIAEKVATPTLSPAPGSYSTAQSVTISCATSGATIRYTTDGSTPTTTSTAYSTPIPVNNGTVIVKAKAFKTGMVDSDTASVTYTVLEKVASPVLSPGGGAYSSTQSVTISCTTSGATIRYTTDGSDPSSASMVYSSPIQVVSTTIVKAIAFKSGMIDSDVATATYMITLPPVKVDTPVVTPAGASFSSAQSVTISCSTSGATIRYTTDGSEPTSTSTAYSSAIAVNSGTITINAKAFKSGMTDSDTASATYTINPQKVATPSLNPSRRQLFECAVCYYLLRDKRSNHKIHK